MASGGLFRKLRITILLYLLLMVAVGTWLSRARTTDWDDTLWVTVYPINGDNSGATADYIDSLTDDAFEPVERFMTREIARYGLALESPVRMNLGQPVAERPPMPPPSRNYLKVAWWSLKLRYWAYRTGKTYDQFPADIQMFVIYYDPDTHDRLRHSLGLQKGLIGVVHGFASRSMAAQNNVIIAHELLHTLGATDKYDLATNQPVYPAGYAEPAREPRYPQRKAEIMAGRTPVSSSESEMPAGLKFTLVGEQTALEINWRD